MHWDSVNWKATCVVIMYGIIIISTAIIGGGADKYLALPTSRCRWTESIVSLERGVCSCAEL